MALNPEQLENVTFTRVKNGYDIAEVRDFLRAVASELRASDDFERAGDEVAAALRGMHHLLVEMKQNAEDEIEQARREAIDAATAMREEAHRDSERLRAEAQRHHDELIREAEARAQRIQEEADAMRAKSEQLVEAADFTVRAKRKEIDDYVVSLTARAEQIARGRISEVIEGHRYALREVAIGRADAAESLRRARRAIETALSTVLAELDLTNDEVEVGGDEAGAESESDLAVKIAADGIEQALTEEGVRSVS